MVNFLCAKGDVSRKMKINILFVRRILAKNGPQIEM